MDALETQPWLEDADGEAHPLTSPFTIGRKASCSLVLEDPEKTTSREHAMLVSDSANRWRVMDLRSRNGTYVNEQIVVNSTALGDGDVLQCGSFRFVFRQPSPARRSTSPFNPSDVTITDLRPKVCWMLVADIMGSTRMSQEMEHQAYCDLMDGWATSMRAIIEGEKGIVNRFAGDMVLAYWVDRAGRERQIVAALREMWALREGRPPRFRTLVHFDRLIFGGAARMGEESLSGPGINFLFKAERIASRTGEIDLFTQPAAERAAAAAAFSDAGAYEVEGFNGQHTLYRIDRAST